jgi:hypothetical protein
MLERRKADARTSSKCFERQPFLALLGGLKTMTPTFGDETFVFRNLYDTLESPIQGRK